MSPGVAQPVSTLERAVVLVPCLAALTVGLGWAPEATLEALGLAWVSVMGVGKYLPLLGVTEHTRFSPWELGAIIWAKDTFIAVVVIYGHHALCHFGVLRRKFEALRGKARLVLRAYPSVETYAVLGLVTFVLLPIPGTSAVLASLLGLLLGLHRRVVILAVSAGGLLGGMLMALLAVCSADALVRLQALEQHAGVKYGFLALLISVVALAIRALSRGYERALQRT